MELETFVNKMISVITGDGRNIVGLMRGFDQTVNIVLQDSHERVYRFTFKYMKNCISCEMRDKRNHQMVALSGNTTIICFVFRQAKDT
jgi:small nuclear ribonucleoprotein (snRNP)-like protein